MFNKIHKWLHNKKHGHNPMCPCGWNMIYSARKGFDNYWICKWKECSWSAFTNLGGGKVKYWR